MKNPFAYSNYVTGESFCNRKKELSELLKYIKGSQNVLLYSHRRYGKSSLIRQLFYDIKEKNLNIGAMHIDLYGTISEKDFITRTFQGLNQLESNFEKLLKSVSSAIKNIKLNLSIEEIAARFENHPMYIQNFLFHLWEEPAKKGFSTDIINKLENVIVEKRSLEHTILWETLSINQKKTLKLILLNNGANLFNADSLKSVSLKTGSLVTKALSSLIKKRNYCKKR